MRKSYVYGGAIVIIVIFAVGAFWYGAQSDNFLKQISEATSAILIPQTASTTALTVATTTTTATPAKTSNNTTTTRSRTGHTTAGSSVPHIYYFKPAVAGIGTTVTILGTGFSRTTNHIMFGVSGGRHHIDGSPDNEVATVASLDGITLNFTIPTSGPSGLLCDSLNHCMAISAIRIAPSVYPVVVRNANGTSQPAMITVVEN